MSKSPGTVSKILWHFTGGPGWDAALSKQTSQLKTDELSFNILNAILDSKHLRTSSYSENVQFQHNSEVRKQLDAHSIDVNLFFETQSETKPVVCVADIPIQHLSFHANRYGKFAIGFKRESLIKAGFNPVLYSNSESLVAFDFLQLISDLNQFTKTLQMSKVLLTQIVSTMQQSVESHDPRLIDGINPTKLVESWSSFLEGVASRISVGLVNHAALVKTFEIRDMDIIFPEREWRLLTNYHFSHNEIAMIILPRSGGWYDRFIEERLEIPRAIPIIAWEDLIEH